MPHELPDVRAEDSLADPRKAHADAVDYLKEFRAEVGNRKIGDMDSGEIETYLNLLKSAEGRPGREVEKTRRLAVNEDNERAEQAEQTRIQQEADATKAAQLAEQINGGEWGLEKL